jgi:hypothetical protein
MSAKQQERPALGPISTQDLERPLSAKLFLSVMAAAASILAAGFGYLLSLGSAINHQLDSMKEDIAQIRPRTESIDKKIDGWGGQFEKRLNHFDDRLDGFAAARLAQGTK